MDTTRIECNHESLSNALIELQQFETLLSDAKSEAESLLRKNKFLQKQIEAIMTFDANVSHLYTNTKDLITLINTADHDMSLIENQMIYAQDDIDVLRDRYLFDLKLYEQSMVRFNAMADKILQMKEYLGISPDVTENTFEFGL